MTKRLRVLLPSDVFPPRSGGAGWSAHTLARALIERGHTVTAVVPRREANDGRRTIEQKGADRPSSFAAQCEDVIGVPTVRVPYWAPGLPIVQNYFRHERFWPRLADTLVEIAQLSTQSTIYNLQSTIVHAQHVQTAAPAVLAGRRLGAPVVITVRDHWPWDYFATGLHGDRIPYARQTWAALATDLPARLGPARGAVALTAIPYMLAHLRRRQQALRYAGAVIAVSGYIARRLAGIVPSERLHVIPNMLDLAAIDAALATPQSSVPAGEPYLLFVGKLERNKGAHLLVEILRELIERKNSEVRQNNFSILNAQFSIPTLVIAGSGPLRPHIERELGTLGVRVRFLDWVDHDEVLRLMAGCELLLFPSAWGEPLSRVPLEASACRAPILAMPTGGTSDIITDGENGALEPTAAGFARRMAALLSDPGPRRALGAEARRVAEWRFAKEAVAPRVEALYRSLIEL